MKPIQTLTVSTALALILALTPVLAGTTLARWCEGLGCIEPQPLFAHQLIFPLINIQALPVGEPL